MRNKAALKVSGLYLLLGIAWIFFSDHLLFLLDLDKETGAQWHTLKGWGYVILSSVLLYVLINRKAKLLLKEIKRKKQAEEELKNALEKANIFREIISKLSTGVVITDANRPDYPICYANPAFLASTGYRLEEAVGNSCKLLYGPETDPQAIDAIDEAAANQQPIDIELVNYRKNGTAFWNEWKINPIFNPIGEPNYIIGLQSDIDDRMQATHFLNIQTEILETIVKGDSLQLVLNQIVTSIEANNPLRTCSILFLNEETQCLHTVAAPSIPYGYTRQIDGIPIGPDVGSCGTAAYLNETIIVDDIESSPLWNNFKHVALEYGYQACWSTPIVSREGKVSGTFAMYSKAVTQPDSFEIHALETFSKLVGMAIDYDRSEERIRESESRYQLIAENATDLICLFDLSGNMEYVSPACVQLRGRLPDIADLQTAFGEDFERLRMSYSEIVNCRQPQKLEVCCKNKAPQWRWLEVQGSPVINGLGELEHVLFVSRDITERKSYERSLEEIAYYDALTELPNRRLLTHKLVEAIEAPADKFIALICIECDRFKNLNESLGYEMGDRFLQLMANRIVGCTGHLGMVSRVGGDEFMILLHDAVSKDNTLQIVELLMGELRMPWQIEQERFYLTSSIGVVFYQEQSASAMLQQSEIAMLQAKRSGKNAYHVFEPNPLEKSSYNPFVLEKQLHGVLERDEFQLWYQPQINYQTGEVVGVEALIRWNHPQLGYIPPAEFIMLAEDTGLIVPIGEWVLRTSCLQVVKWDRAGYGELHMSINISPRQLREPGFVAMAVSVLAETKVDPRRLYLEITEGMLLNHDPITSEILHNLKELGLRLSVDDFGTGYSSLSYIKRYPIDLIKIDRSFVQDLPGDSNDIAIVKAIIDLSKSLQISVLAEGTENQEQIRCLQELGCDVAQGYYFAKPLNEDDFLFAYQELSKKAKQFQ